MEYLQEETKVIMRSDEGLKLETLVFEFFPVANLPFRLCG